MEYTIRIEPDASADDIYIQLKNGGKLSEEVKFKEQNTILNFEDKPQEIVIERKASFIKRLFTSFYCKYIEVQSSESVFYFPVFNNISTTKETIAEGSGKLPWEDDEEERENGMDLKKNLQDLVGWTAPCKMTASHMSRPKRGFRYEQISDSAAHKTLSLMSLAEDDSSGIFWELCPEKWKKSLDKMQPAIQKTHDRLKTVSLDFSHMNMAVNPMEPPLVGSPG
ncbi:uncharacterized protein LOC125746421 [Brienomyrus brachyistius]|uniref:uncharacterized protein LOC125746421 n=1 Tax=Brienomyrus brachyistius TaxID=42636 RepID=UPI0020B20FE9|nr:uncharacterized protein LOC125746421 [Brienomyrus brachyistius]